MTINAQKYCQTGHDFTNAFMKLCPPTINKNVTRIFYTNPRKSSDLLAIHFIMSLEKRSNHKLRCFKYVSESLLSLTNTI